MTSPTAPTTPLAAPPVGRARRLLLAPATLLGLGWCVVVPLLTLQALLETASFFGEQPDAADRAAQHHDLALAAGLSAAVVVAGLTLSVQARSNAAATLFALLVVPTLVIGLLWLGTTPAPVRTGPVAPATHQAPCQEHSGGDTRCPGG